jgi:hypothetical protein
MPTFSDATENYRKARLLAASQAYQRRGEIEDNEFRAQQAAAILAANQQFAKQQDVAQQAALMAREKYQQEEMTKRQELSDKARVAAAGEAAKAWKDRIDDAQRAADIRDFRNKHGITKNPGESDESFLDRAGQELRTKEDQATQRAASVLRGYNTHLEKVQSKRDSLVNAEAERIAKAGESAAMQSLSMLPEFNDILDTAKKTPTLTIESAIFNWGNAKRNPSRAAAIIQLYNQALQDSQNAAAEKMPVTAQRQLSALNLQEKELLGSRDRLMNTTAGQKGWEHLVLNADQKTEQQQVSDPGGEMGAPTEMGIPATPASFTAKPAVIEAMGKLGIAPAAAPAKPTAPANTAAPALPMGGFGNWSAAPTTPISVPEPAPEVTPEQATAALAGRRPDYLTPAQLAGVASGQAALPAPLTVQTPAQAAAIARGQAVSSVLQAMTPAQMAAIARGNTMTARTIPTPEEWMGLGTDQLATYPAATPPRPPVMTPAQAAAMARGQTNQPAMDPRVLTPGKMAGIARANAMTERTVPTPEEWLGWNTDQLATYPVAAPPTATPMRVMTPAQRAAVARGVTNAPVMDPRVLTPAQVAGLQRAPAAAVPNVVTPEMILRLAAQQGVSRHTNANPNVLRVRMPERPPLAATSLLR